MDDMDIKKSPDKSARPSTETTVADTTTDSPRPQDTKTKLDQPAQSDTANSKRDKTSDAADRADDSSEAETIVLASKDGTPIKARKPLKQGDAGADPAALTAKLERRIVKQESPRMSSASGKPAVKAKTPAAHLDATKSEVRKNIEAGSVSQKKRVGGGDDEVKEEDSRQRSGVPRAGSEPEIAPRKPSESSHWKARESDKDMEPSKSGDKSLLIRRKSRKYASDEDSESRKARRQRTSSSVDTVPLNRPGSSKGSKNDAEITSRNRSLSPQTRQHRRSLSTQFSNSTAGGFGQKKRRVPAPLLPEAQSEESSDGETAPARGSKARSLATPASADSTMSPVKIVPHKKHVDAHGQTLLARACARGEYEIAKQRLSERPEDLNIPDYAGNSPLQIAALNGFERIVKLLLDAGCNIDCMNYDRDTPLLDAVDNGHVKVVKVLLDAGVNPRKANVNGEEPLDRIEDDADHAKEMRTLLQRAKQATSGRRKTSEERQDLQEVDNPRTSLSAVSTLRRGTTVRSNKTSNSLLYTPMNEQTLRQAAGRGDQTTVERILSTRESFDDPESMVAAARGGHDEVMNLLLALGSANPDPEPVPGGSREFGTPILAAIGQENIKVVQLLLSQSTFDPTRKFRGKTYYEIAESRKGANWIEEEHLLKNAYDAYKKSHKSGGKHKSPLRIPKSESHDVKDASKKSHKRRGSSLDREEKHPASIKSIGVNTQSRKRANSSESNTTREMQTSPRRGPGRPKKDERALSESRSNKDSPTISSSKLLAKSRRTESEAAVLSSDGESAKPPRRKLVSGKDLKGERDRSRRASMASEASSLREPASPKHLRQDETSDRAKAERRQERPKGFNQDESPDRTNAMKDGPVKRHRVSTSPMRSKDCEGDAPTKKRKLVDHNGKDRPAKRRSLSPAQISRAQRPSSPLQAATQEDKRDEKLQETSAAKGNIDANAQIHVKSEDDDVDMTDASAAHQEQSTVTDMNSPMVEQDDTKSTQHDLNELRQQQERLEQEAALAQKEADEKDRAEREALEQSRRAEAARKQQHEEQEAAVAAAAAAAAAAAEAEKVRREQEEADRLVREKEDEERRRREQEEQEKLRQVEEERLRQLQEEQEAAEAARRKREEEEREQRRIAREAEVRRAREQQEQMRLMKLPPLLQWLDVSGASSKTVESASLFSSIIGIRHDCIRPQASNTPSGRETWMLNIHAALLLGESDLQLSRFTSWERLPASVIAKEYLYCREYGDMFSCTVQPFKDLAMKMPNCFLSPRVDPWTGNDRSDMKREERPRFVDLDMFFVKVTDLMYTISNTPYLRNLRLTVTYAELPTQLPPYSKPIWDTSTWKVRNDPEYPQINPAVRVYINGQVVGGTRGLQRAIASKVPLDPPVPNGGWPFLYNSATPKRADSLEAMHDQDGHLLTNGHVAGHVYAAAPDAITPTSLVNGSNGLDGDL